MNAPATHAVVAYFDSDEGASSALATLYEAQRFNGQTVLSAAVLTVDADTKIHVSETADMSGKKGAAVGGVVGGVIGLLGSAVVPPLAIGAAVVGLAAKLRDSGFPNDRLEELSARLEPGHSILVVAVADGAMAMEEALRRAGATVVREAVEGQLAQALDADATVAPPEAAPNNAVNPSSA